jgi:hypothetical protein
MVKIGLETAANGLEPSWKNVIASSRICGPGDVVLVLLKLSRALPEVSSEAEPRQLRSILHIGLDESRFWRPRLVVTRIEERSSEAAPWAEFEA